MTLATVWEDDYISVKKLQNKLHTTTDPEVNQQVLITEGLERIGH